MNWYKHANYQELESLLEKADLSLSDKSQEAISNFVGHPPMSKQQRQNLGDDPFDLFGVMNEEMLEEAFSANPAEQGMFIRKDLEQKIEPVKEYLRRMFGDSLYRHQRPLEGSEKLRNLLSWTLSKKFVEYSAGIQPVSDKILTDADIEKYVQQFDRNDFVQIDNYVYRTDAENRGTDIFDADGSHITGIYEGTDSLRNWLREQRDENARWNQKIENDNQSKRQNIMSQSIPLQDIIWITNRAGQWEFVVKT